MTTTTILALATLCAIFGGGLIQARINGAIPGGFWNFDKDFTLGPQKYESFGNRTIFTFGNEEQGGERIKKFSRAFRYKVAKDFLHDGGYPNFQDNGFTSDQLTYAEITVEADNDSANANFIFWKDPQSQYKYTYFKYLVQASNVSKITFTIEVYAKE